MVSEINSMIFIPDISGFTKFVNENEIQHSQHIIEELIHVILNANEMDLKVSEIEGDAVLFYREGEAPSLDQISNQTKNMFLSFHNYLQQIKKDTICQCGACRTASKLTLKFFLHYGEIAISQIYNHTKLMGKNVILAHRIMKNSVPGNEYLLMTEKYLDKYDNDQLNTYLNWSVIKSGQETYQHIGDVGYKYVDLSSLRSELSPLPDIEKAKKYPDPIEVSLHIDAPVDFLYSIIVDLDLRTEWFSGLRRISYDQNEIPRIGMKHICDLLSGTVKLETIKNHILEGKAEYAEKAVKNFLFPQATIFYILSDHQKGTEVTIQFHYKKKFGIGWLIDLLLRDKLTSEFIASIQNLKTLVKTKRLED